MGNLTNYHSHSLYCDGRAGMEDFVRFALSEGFTSYGFSSHAPLPFSTAWTMEWDIMDDYLSEFHRLKEKYAGRIELYIGLEIDYLNEASNPSIARFRELPLDYRIGSVHLLYNDKGEVVDVDVPADTFKTIVDGHFCGDLEHVVRLYYGRLTRMLELGGLILWAMPIRCTTMQHAIARDCWRSLGMMSWLGRISQILPVAAQVEVNTKAYHDLGTFYPNERYFSYLHDLGVRVQVNSDSHYPERISNGRPEALCALRKAGYESVMELHGGEWKEMPIVF